MLNTNTIAAAAVVCILVGGKPDNYDKVSHNPKPALERLKEQSIPNGLNKLVLPSVD